jgi:hypothetical protein
MSDTTSLTPWQRQRYRCSLTPFKFVRYCSTIVFVYMSYRVVLSWGQSTLPGQPKHAIDMLNDWTALGVLTTLCYLVGNFDKTFGWKTTAGMFLGMYGFAALGSISFLQNSLSSVDTWEPGTWAFYVAGFVFVIAVLLYQYTLAKKLGSPDIFLVGLAFVACIFVFSLLIYLLDTSGRSVSFHPHHYQLMFILSLFIRFSDPISQVLSGMTMGILTQGIAAYGPARLIEEAWNCTLPTLGSAGGGP